MARYDYRKPVVPIGQAHRTTGAGFAQRGGYGAIGSGVAIGDFPQLGPDLAGEFATGQVQGNAELLELASEIPGKLFFDLLQVLVVSWRHGIAIAVLQLFDFPGQCWPIEKLQQYQAGRSAMAIIGPKGVVRRVNSKASLLAARPGVM